MSLDLTVLRLLKYRNKYENLIRAVPAKVLDARTQVILSDFGRFFGEFPDAPRVDRGAFSLFFKMIHPRLSEEDLSFYDQYFKRIEQDIEPALEDGLMRRLVEAATAHDIADKLLRYNEGQEVDLRAELTACLDVYDTLASKNVVNPQVLDAIEDLLKAEENDSGLHWRLPCLNRSVKPIQGGDFIVVAGRPDKGKTTFLTDQLTHMAAQVDALYPGENRSIVWCNNEGPGKRIVTRAFQSALNATHEELIALANQPAEPGYARYKTLVRQRYAEALGGRPGVLRIFDVHDWWSHDVEDKIIKRFKPALIVFDMVDNIKFGGAAINGGERTDQLLEAMYQWARVRGVKHDCGVIATSQISADGDGMTYPTLSQLKDSKTGKQGAADVIITLGASNDATLENSRFIGTTKNKKRRTGAPASPRTEVTFDGHRGRYVERSA